MTDSMKGNEAAERRIALAASANDRRLSLAGLGLETLPVSLRSLTGIRGLDLSGNRLTQVPAWLGELRSLEELSLRGNRLVALPESLADLVLLQRIDLADNQFVEVPRWLGRLNLDTVELAGNADLLIPPQHVVAEGTEAVLAHLRHRDARAGHPQTIALSAAEKAPVAVAGVADSVPRGGKDGSTTPAGMDGRQPLRRRRGPRLAVIGVAVAVLVGVVIAVLPHGGHGSTAAGGTGPAGLSGSIAPESPSALGYTTSSITGPSASASASASVTPSASPSAVSPDPSASSESAVSATPTHAAAVTAVKGGIITGFGGLCLDDANARTVNDNQIDLATCNGTGAQKWTVMSDGTVRVFGMCLDTQAGGTADGTTVVLYTCDGATSQKFIPQGDGSLYNAHARKCLDDPVSSTKPGTVLQIWTCTGNGNQQWNLPA